MDFLREMVADKPNTVYGDILPVSRETDTGKWHYPVIPESVRNYVRGAADLLEGPKTGQMTPGALGTLATTMMGRGDLQGTDVANSIAAAVPHAPTEEPPPTAQQTLQDTGVRLTPGQRMGGFAKSVEDKATSLPIAGDAIQGARTRGMHDFNIGTINKALEPLGVTLPEDVGAGHAAIEAGQNVLSDAYDQVLPNLRFRADNYFAKNVADLRDLTSELPASEAGQFENILKNRVFKALGPEGSADGITLKNIESQLTKKVGDLKAGQQYQLADAVNELRATIRDTLERQNPDAAKELQQINQSYAMFSRVEDAATRRATSGGVFTPSDLLQSIKQNAVRTGNRKAFARGDQFLQDLAQAGQDILPSKVPDSGTTGRALLAAGTLAAGGGGAAANLPGAAASLAGLLGAAAPYTRPGIAASNAIMDVAPDVGNVVSQLARELAKGTTESSILMRGQQGQKPFGGI